MSGKVETGFPSDIARMKAARSKSDSTQSDFEPAQIRARHETATRTTPPRWSSLDRSDKSRARAAFGYDRWRNAERLMKKP
jgi:hypothetical protein